MSCSGMVKLWPIVASRLLTNGINVPDNRHFPILTGQSNFKLSSRSLARRLLFQHLLNLHKIDVHVFKSLDDPEWLHYINITRVGNSYIGSAVTNYYYYFP